MILTVLLIFVVAIVAVIFALQNPNVVAVTFFGQTTDGSLGLWLLIALGVGILLGILLMTPSLISRSFTAARHKRRVAELESTPKESAPKSHTAQMMSAPPVEQKPKDPAA